MQSSKPIVITFAGVPGSSKSIVAHYLSECFGLSLFSTDNIRFEVKEDLLARDIRDAKALHVYDTRVAKRREAMLARNRTFILDGSVDRSWSQLKQEFDSAGYGWFVIDMELSAAFLENLYIETGRLEAVEELAVYLGQHETFMAEYASDVNLTITDNTFAKRTTLAATAVTKLIGDNR